ncbi:probable E3 ubiquitin-protein ligase makorin-1 [Octopus sinensis]|uniref:RING-type E3 ubiquitin transferase n=1 Tax=Octopus sinensis TaxID=2607531 RepID=A0A6P7TT48_9MOLL|nr:probable E3 ubiquitin-protein ligase makorin-1 [Octopus sinensis]
MASAAVVEKSCGAGGAGSNKAVLCKYYINGVCRDGKTCRYSHDQETTPPDMVCRYYLQGCCSYGPMCRYDHVKPKGDNSTVSRPISAQSQTLIKTPTTLKQCVGLAPPPPPSLLPSSPATLPSMPHHNTQNGFCRTVKPSSITTDIDWDLDLLGHNSADIASADANASSFPASRPWSTAPSTSDKVILRGGRIKTKADWAKDSQEFVPRKPIAAPSLTYAQALSAEADGTLAMPPQPFDPGSSETTDHGDCAAPEYTPKFDYPDPIYQEKVLCPYLEHGACPDMENCCYLHGDLCEMCGANVLHPTNMELRKEHETECMRRLEENMEYSFLMAGSKSKECTICMETVLDKKPPDNRFGLLPNCNHTFCLSCIRKWRSSTLDKDVIRSCPQCRISSNFVTPSNVWVEDKEQKDKIINDYKEKMRKKPCKYFDMGRSKCPFGDSCFYKHAYPDGKLASPEKPGSRRHRSDADGTISCISEQLLWEFISEREQAAAVAMEVFDDDFYNMIWTSSDSDDDDDDDDFTIFTDVNEHFQFMYGVGVVGEVDDDDDDDNSSHGDDADIDESNDDEEDDDDDNDADVENGNDADDDDDDDDDDSCNSVGNSISSISSSGGDSCGSSSSSSSSECAGGGGGGGERSSVAASCDGDDGDVGGGVVGGDNKVCGGGERRVSVGGGGGRGEEVRGEEGVMEESESNCDGRRKGESKDKMKGGSERS